MPPKDAYQGTGAQPSLSQINSTFSIVFGAEYPTAIACPLRARSSRKRNAESQATSHHYGRAHSALGRVA